MQKGKANKTFALVGLGFIATKHLSAIESLGGRLLAVCDNDVSKRDKCPHGAKFIEDFGDFVKFVAENEIDYVAICAPNNLHVEMVERLLRETKTHIICEKPVVTSINDLKRVCDDRVSGMHQLRYYKLPKIEKGKKYNVLMNINIRRDQWYFDSWKGDAAKSGGLLFNIGIHYFDILVQLFGMPQVMKTDFLTHHGGMGHIDFIDAHVEWKINLDAPQDNQYRIIRCDEFVIDLTSGIDDLHKPAYEAILAGNGIKIKDTIVTYELVENLTNQKKEGFMSGYKLQGKFHNIYGDPKIGDGTKIGSFVEIGPDVVIGKNCKIQAYVSIPGGITIEDNVFIGPKATFLNDKYPPSGQWSKTLIGKGASIGGGAVILPGVTIGENAKVGAGAVVTKDIPLGETWVGNPAHKLK